MKQTVKNLLRKLASLNPAVSPRYDASLRIYRRDGDAEPALAVSHRADYTVNLRQVMVLLAAFFTLRLCFRIRRGR